MNNKMNHKYKMKHPSAFYLKCYLFNSKHLEF